MALVSIFTSICSTVVKVIDKLYPSHIKDFIHKLHSSCFDSTVVYTDKNVEMEGVKTSSVLTPDIISRATDFKDSDVSFKASTDKVTQLPKVKK